MISYFLFLYWFAINCNLVATNVAVVEYKPIDALTIPDNLERLAANIQNFIDILKDIPDAVNLVIYPGSVLNTGLLAWEINTFVTLNENPCYMSVDKYPQYIRNIACAALANEKNLIINTVEKEECDESESGVNCETYGYKFYNCDIVFGSDGSIIERYRKYNLFGEYDLDTPEVADHTIITVNTEKIGVFTSFDLLFKTPAEDLIEAGVQSVAHPTMWFAALPFFTALQTQQMWSHEHNIKLYVAGANDPQRGSGGSGIFDGNSGPIISDIIAEGGSKYYTDISTIQNLKLSTEEEIDELGRAMQDFYIKSDDLSFYSSILLDTSNTSQQLYKVCHQLEVETEFCCIITPKLSFDSKLQGNIYTYHLVAYSGVRTFGGVRDGGVDICGVVACVGKSLLDCGQRFPLYDEVVWPVEFEKLEIRANFSDNGNRTQYPNSLLSSVRPIHPVQTLWTKQSYDLEDNGVLIERTWALKQSQNRLMTFAIFGRNFALDTKPEIRLSSGVGKHINFRIYVWMILFIGFLLHI